MGVRSLSPSSWDDQQNTMVSSAVQQWERRNSRDGQASPSNSQATSNNRHASHAVSRPSYPPPAPSSGAGVRRYSAPFGQEALRDPLQQSISQPITTYSTHIPSPYIEQESSPDPYTYGYTERHVDEDEEVYEPLKQSYERADNITIPVFSPSSSNMKRGNSDHIEKKNIFRSQHSTRERNENGLYTEIPPQNVYVGGESAMNPKQISGRSIGSRFTLPSWMTSKITVKEVYRQLIWLLAGIALLWIPGLVAILCYGALNFPLYAYPTVFGVGLFWWSVWLSSAWAGIWICWLASYIAPITLRISLGILAINFKRQITYLEVLQKYVATLLWSVLIWITYLTIVWMHFPGYQGIDSSLLDPLSAGNSTMKSGSGNSTASSNSTSSSSSSSDSILNSLWGTGSTSTAHTAALQAEAELSNYSSNANWLITFSRFFFGLAICCALLLAQKLCIQSIANSFHEVTYSDRIRLAKYHTSVLVTLYSHAKRIKFGTNGSLLAEHGKAVISYTSPLSSTNAREEYQPPTKEGQLLRTGNKIDWAHFRNTLSLGGKKVPSIINLTAKVQDIGSPPIAFANPFSPEAIVETSLESSDETKKLARRVFDAYSVPMTASDDHMKNGNSKGHKHDNGDDDGVNPLSRKIVTLASIETAFKSKKDAVRAYAVLDRDGNGDCTWEEILSVCLEIHRERMCLLASMHDVDAAVAKLDQILRGVWITMSCVIVAALLSVRFSTLIASLGTILLGLSWLISSTAQESLASIVWVFCKHPIDVGDVVVVPGLLSVASSTVTKDTIAALQGYTDGDTFEVEEVQLMSTVLKTTTTNKHVQVSNYVLSQKPLVNLRRSGPIEEPFTLSVGYDTPLESIEALREGMCSWLTSQGRDFRPGLDVALEGLDDQTQLKIVLTIRYKSNWQDSRLRMQRRNRWISALKQLLKKYEIYGPGHILAKNTIIGDNSSRKITTSEPIKSFQLMDKGEDVLLDGKDEFELFGKRGMQTLHSHHTETPMSGTITVGKDEKLDEGFDAAQNARSRLNEAIPPTKSLAEGDSRTSMYAQHSSSTTQLDAVNVQGWHTNEDELYRRQEEEQKRTRASHRDLEMGEK